MSTKPRIRVKPPVTDHDLAVPQTPPRSATHAGDKVAEANRGRAWGINAPGARQTPRSKPVNVHATQGHVSPVKLLNDVKDRRVDPKTLSVEARRACLTVMANGKQTSAELAEFFGVSPQTIRADVTAIRQELGAEASRWTPEQVLGRLLLASEKYQARAMRMEDPGLAWSIERDTMKLLIELGLAGPKARPQGEGVVRLTMEVLQQGYERSREILTKALDARLTGEVVDVEAQVTTAPALPVKSTFPDQPQQRPQLADVEAEVDHEEPDEDVELAPEDLIDQ